MVLPSPHCGNAPLIFPSASFVVPYRIPSSRVTVIVSVLPVAGSCFGTVRGAISVSKTPAIQSKSVIYPESNHFQIHFCAASALWKDSAASVSMSSREMLKSFATFSEVQPIGSIVSLAIGFAIISSLIGEAPWSGLIRLSVLCRNHIRKTNVLEGHAICADSKANLNLTRTNLVRNYRDGHQATRAEPIHNLHGCCLGYSSGES